MTAWRDQVQTMVESLVHRDVTNVPLVAHDRLFFLRRHSHNDYASLCVCEPDGTERVLKTPAAVNGNRFDNFGLLAISSDGKRVALLVRSDGRDEATTIIVNGDDGSIHSTITPQTEGRRISLSLDLEGYYWVKHTATRECTVVYTRLGPETDKNEQDRWIVPADAPRAVSVQPVGPSGIVLLRVRDEVDPAMASYYLGVDTKRDPILLLSKVRYKAQFEQSGNTLFLSTNWEAPRGRILKATLIKGVLSTWQEVVPESEGTIVHFSNSSNNLFVGVFVERSIVLRVYDMDGNRQVSPSYPKRTVVGPVMTSGDRDDAFYEVSSNTSPASIWRLHAPTGTQQPWHSSAKPEWMPELDCIESECRSRDGTIVPLTLTFRKGLTLNCNTPTILAAYGGFGVSDTPRFSNRFALWLAMGGLHVYAHVRGGGEFGDEWHRDGMLEKKQNSIDDFISAAELLISQRYTRPERLAIVGGSNAGLLVGAALTQRPELFAAVVCFGPILDMLRYHLFPGGEIGVAEYGTADDPAVGKYLRTYSPYHAVKHGTRYPAVLFISGDADTRCHPMHAMKMTARLQIATVSDRPIVLDYHEKRGHAALLPLSERVQTLTNQFCFLIRELCLTLGRDNTFQVD